MPKITIKEVDQTAQSTSTYSNLTVVVPGLVDAAKYAEHSDVFDDNGIYECDSQSDFEQYVGLVDKLTYSKERVYATAVVYDSAASGIDKYAITIDSIAKYEKYLADGNLYTYSEAATEDDNKGIALRINTGTEKAPAYQYYTLTAVKADEITTFGAISYVVVPAGKEGNVANTDAINNVQMGNQIAYELLGMGYTVLYKKIDEYANLIDSNTYAALKDKANYDFRFIVSGCLCDNNQLVEQLEDVCIPGDVHGGRGDCVALLSVDESEFSSKTGTDLIKEIAKASKLITDSDLEGTYCAWFTPSVCLDIPNSPEEYKDNEKFPASFYYLACFAYANNNGYAEWYAAAGYTRGVCKYNVTKTSVILGEAAVNALEPRTTESAMDNLDCAINVITKVKNNYYLWGNRTACKLSEELQASHFLNIRNLCTTLKKQIYVACRKFTFDPNSDTLWVNFVNAIKPTLEAMKADQGIEDYKIVQIRTTQKATLKARVRIIPIEAVEDFDIEVSLENSFGTTTATVSE